MIRAALALALWLVAAVAVAQPERRVALVIGNAEYRNAASLANPVRDAISIAAALNELGFEVLVARDADRADMERRLREFGRKLEGATVGLFYYAGHGIQLDGENWLLPVDAQLETERDVPFEAVPLGLALAQMEDDTRTSIVILDACRENPFRGRPGRSRVAGARPGLASVEAGLGTLIVYATQPNAVAFDGPAEGNSPFAAALLRHIDQPAIELRRMLTLVRTDVVQATGRRQVPWDHSALMGDFFFRAQPPVALAAAVAPPPSTPPRTVPPTPAPAAAPQAAPAAEATSGDAAPELDPGLVLAATQRVHIQRALANLGFDQDGRSIGSGWGIHPGAIRRFQATRGGPATGRLTPDQAAWLLARTEGAQPSLREAELELGFVRFAFEHARSFFNPFWAAIREHARAAGQPECRGRACIRVVQEALGLPPTGAVSQALLDAMAAAPVMRGPDRGPDARAFGDWRLLPQTADGTCIIETSATGLAGPSLDVGGMRVFLEARGGMTGYFARVVDFDPARGPQLMVGRQSFPLAGFGGGQWLSQAMREARPDGSYASETRMVRAIAAASAFELVGPARWGQGQLRASYSARGFADALKALDGCARGDLRWVLQPTTPEAGPVPLTQPPTPANAARAAADLAHGVTLNAEQRVRVIRALHGLGHQAEGFADAWRLLRAQAIIDFQKSRREEPTGRLSRAQVNVLLATPQARQPTAWEAEGANKLVKLSAAYDLLWGSEWPVVTEVRAYATALGLAGDCSWRDCLGLVQRQLGLRQTRMMDDATFAAMGAAPRVAAIGGAEAEAFGAWRFTPARGRGECVLAAAPARIEGVSHWTQSRIELRRNPGVGRTTLTARFAGFVDFAPDAPPALEVDGRRIALEPLWASPYFGPARSAISGDGWTRSAEPLRALASAREVAVVGQSRWGGPLRLVYATDGFAEGFARLDAACGGGALVAAHLGRGLR